MCVQDKRVRGPEAYTGAGMCALARCKDCMAGACCLNLAPARPPYAGLMS